MKQTTRLAFSGALLTIAMLAAAEPQMAVADSWYDQGYDFGKNESFDKLLYGGGWTPPDICTSFAQQVELSGGSDDDASDFYDGCLDGIREQLGDDEYANVS